MKRIFIFLLTLLLLLSFSACTQSKKAKTELCIQDLSKTLYEIQNSTTDDNSFIYSSRMTTMDETSSHNHEISKKIASLVSFSVLSIDTKEDTAQAHVSFTVPDVYRQITEIAAMMQENNTEILLEALVDKLDKNNETKDFDVIVDLKLVDGHWYLIPSGELANAFSGGIIEQYSTMGERVIEHLLEEDNHG